ncbi:MAG: virulence RhuM family protein [Xanthobacteraceae bacterium]|nr:virulence RhuM family protein [Xanthobacteraceae bacterium]
MTDNENEPVHLVEDEETGDRFLVYGTDKGLRLDIRYEGETLWMTQAQIAQLFGVDRSVITKHIANVYAEGELDAEATSAKIAQVRQEGSRRVERQIEHYNLDAVISVGYRVSSAQATVFRRWATGILVQFAKKGFVVDAPRLKQPENADRVAELREIIRDIRSDEANVYRELRRICAMCQDYDGTTEVAREFYQRTQAKLVYAVTSHTPSEIVATRANHKSKNMGLQTWPNDNIRKTDVAVSKNYLAEGEIKELNRLTTILLDIFEDQLDIGRLVVMQDAQTLLDQQLRQLGRTVLRSGGSVKASDAKRIAEAQYEKFDRQRKLERHQEADERIADLAKEAKKLPKSPRR